MRCQWGSWWKAMMGFKGLDLIRCAVVLLRWYRSVSEQFLRSRRSPMRGMNVAFRPMFSLREFTGTLLRFGDLMWYILEACHILMYVGYLSLHVFKSTVSLIYFHLNLFLLSSSISPSLYQYLYLYLSAVCLGKPIGSPGKTTFIPFSLSLHLYFKKSV